MLKKVSFVLVLAGVLGIFAACPANVPGSRKECYQKEYCESAVGDCFAGGVLICNAMGGTFAAGSNGFCSPVLTALDCADARKTCERKCDAAHHY